MPAGQAMLCCLGGKQKHKMEICLAAHVDGVKGAHANDFPYEGVGAPYNSIDICN